MADIRKPKKTALGTFLRGRRVAKGWSTSDLEKRMTVDESTIAKVETGVISTPGRPMLQQFAKALGVDIKVLLAKLPKQPASKIAAGGRPVGKQIDNEKIKGGIVLENGGLDAEIIANLLEKSDSTHSEADVELNEKSDEEELEEKAHYGEVSTPTFGATSFDDIDKAEEAAKKAREVHETADKVSDITRNIMFNADPEDRPGLLTKLGTDFKNRISSVFKSEAKKEVETEVKEDVKDTNTQFMVFKEGDTYKFISAYSNNIIDEDNPPEIIASKSHERFEEMVDKGEVPLPELWLWHIEDWRIGQVDVVTYDKENGIAIAAGHFFKEAEPIAITIQNNPEIWGVSHGMPSNSIMRNKDTRTIIEKHITKEISPLPRYAAANKRADFTILKEKDMSITDKKKDALSELGINADMLETIEASNQAASKQADADGLARKEVADTPDKEPAEAPVETPEEKETEVLDEKKEEEPTSAFSKEQAEELANFIKPLTANIVNAVMTQVQKQIAEQITPIVEKLNAEEKSLDQEVKERIRQTPPASLESWMYGEDGLLKGQSATTSPDTKVDGRTSMAKKAGPTETKEDENVIMASGNPIADSVVNRILNNDLQKELEEKAAA